MKTQSLKQALNYYKFDAAFGAPGATKKNLVTKSVFILSAMRITDGILKTNAQNYGMSTTRKSTRVKAFAYSLCPTGLS
jgi:hypothetical protein